MNDHDETWQQRIRELYRNVEDLYAHVEVTTVVFDHELVPDLDHRRSALATFLPALTAIARRVRDSAEPVHDVPLDSTGRRRAQGHPLRHAGEVIGVACFVEDDSARRELFVRCALAIFDGYRQNEVALLERERTALEEARSANKLRDQFMATISHELRAPVASILLWEQVLRHDEIDAATRERALDSIHESATAQTLLVSDLLDVSRAINGKLHIDLHSMSIQHLLVTSIDNARPSAHARGVEIVTDLAPGLHDVLGDAHRLRQVFENLLTNAIKCTDHGRVTVRSKQVGVSVVVEVEDTGRGIASDFLPHIFEPFSQEERASRGGLGLGLAIARQLVELHGGTLSAQSAGLGRGALFTVSLPSLGAVVRDESLLRLPATRDQLQGVHVLAVDDDPHVVGALRVLLRRAGAVVATAESAAIANGILQRTRIDVVLSDLSMPEEDGYSLVRQLRANATTRSIPAIAVTAHVRERDRERALEAGFDMCVEKPIDVPLLISSITALIATRSAQA